MRVIIAGLGDVGTQLAEDLNSQRGFRLVLIDQDEEKCEDLSESYDALVLNGDGTEPDLLEKAGARDTDALIATTGSDALNMVIATVAKKFSIPTVVSKLNNTNLRTTARQLGVDHVISPKISAATEIAGLLQGYDVLDFSLLVQGGVKLVEISPGEQAGKKLKEVDLPEGTLITSILRDGVAIIPRGQAELKKGDILIVLAESMEKEVGIKRLFGEIQTGLRPGELQPG